MTDLKKPDEAKKSNDPKESPKLNTFEIGLGSKKVFNAVRDAARTITSSLDTKLTDYYKKIKGQEQKQEQNKKLKK